MLCDYIYSRRGIWTLVCEGEVLDMFLKIDMSQLRAKYFSVCIPPPGLEPITPSVANPPVPVVEETHANYPFRCGVERGGLGRCSASFKDLKGLINHVVHTKDGFHGYRNYARTITLTNQCVHCRSVFKSVTCAKQHTVQAEANGHCATSRSAYEELEEIRELVCPICGASENSHDELQSHLASHSLRPPQKLVIPRHRISTASCRKTNFTDGSDGYGTVLAAYQGDIKFSTATLAGYKMVKSHPSRQKVAKKEKVFFT